jgi:hypothetical protein
MKMERDESGRGRKTRLHVFWGTSIFATLIFVMFAYAITMAPAGGSAPKLWMLSIAGALLAVPLFVGTWKYATTEAPIRAWPFETLVTVFLFVEFAMCVINIFGVAHATWIP